MSSLRECVGCGSSASDAHHVARRRMVADLTVNVCRFCHRTLTREHQEAGVPPDGGRVDATRAIIVGTGDVFDLAAGRPVMRRLVRTLSTVHAAAEGSARWVSRPSAHARRSGRRPRRREVSRERAEALFALAAGMVSKLIGEGHPLREAASVDVDTVAARWDAAGDTGDRHLDVVARVCANPVRFLTALCATGDPAGLVERWAACLAGVLAGRDGAVADLAEITDALWELL